MRPSSTTSPCCKGGIGRTAAVALMGSSYSPEQAELIVKLTADGGHVWLMPDGEFMPEHEFADLPGLPELQPSGVRSGIEHPLLLEAQIRPLLGLILMCSLCASREK